MKIIKTTLLLALMAAMTGCFSEDDSMCPPRINGFLRFSLPDAQSNDIFATNISQVDVVIYDAGGAFVATKHLDQSALNSFQGVQLALNPGTYGVVCWGNIAGNSKMVGEKTADDPYVTYMDIISGKVGDLDKLYHGGSITTRAVNISGAYQIKIPSKGSYDGTATFKSAHRQLEVYVKGYTEGGNPALPKVELAGLDAAVGVIGGGPVISGLGKVDNSQSTQNVTVGADNYAAAQFTTFWFDLVNTITINIYSSSGDLIYSMPLEDAIEPMTDPNVVIIKIVLEFIGTRVVVTMPDWGSNDIDWSK